MYVCVCANDRVAADGDSMLDGSSDRDGGSSTHVYPSPSHRSGSHGGKISEFTVVIDARTGIDDAEVTDRGSASDDGSLQDHGTGTHRGEL